MHPFVALMRKYRIDDTNSPAQSLDDEGDGGLVGRLGIGL